VITIQTIHNQDHQFDAYHTAFVTASITQFKSNVEVARPHRTELPPPPENWKQAKQHKYSQKFKEAAVKEISDLAARKTWIPVKKENVAQRPLPLK
jgi:hypothetical protein